MAQAANKTLDIFFRESKSVISIAISNSRQNFSLDPTADAVFGFHSSGPTLLLDKINLDDAVTVQN